MGLFDRHKKSDNKQPTKLSTDNLLNRINELNKQASILIADVIDGDITDCNIEYFNRLKNDYQDKTEIELLELIECFWGGHIVGYSYAESSIISAGNVQKAELLNKLYPTYIDLKNCHAICVHEKTNFYPTDIKLIDKNICVLK